MLHSFSRTEMIIGTEALDKLKKSKVAIFGIGGVGSFTCEALARTGVGSFVLVDKDCVDITNLNRQIHATTKTIGMPKVEVMKERILSINPDAQVTTYQIFYGKDTADTLLADGLDYCVDAIDTISSKIDLAVRCKQMGIRLISSMGAGNKMDPTAFRVDDIYSTTVDPIAKVMRRELRKRGVHELKVVYSAEKPKKPSDENGETIDASDDNVFKRRSTPGSIAFIPSVVGLILAGEVIKDLIDWRDV